MATTVTLSVTAEDLELLSAGAMTVRQCCAFSGLGRTTLFALMNNGTLPWFTREDSDRRMLPRGPVVEYLARLYAATKG